MYIIFPAGTSSSRDGSWSLSRRAGGVGRARNHNNDNNVTTTTTNNNNETNNNDERSTTTNNNNDNTNYHDDNNDNNDKFGGSLVCRGGVSAEFQARMNIHSHLRKLSVIPFGEHPSNLERYGEDQHGPCARMVRTDREAQGGATWLTLGFLMFSENLANTKGQYL